MVELREVIEQISVIFCVNINEINVFPHETGVWGNTLYEIKIPNYHFLYKQFHSFDDVTISYNPPNVSVEKRVKNSVFFQELALNAMKCKSIIIPKIRLTSRNSFVMDYLDGGSSLKLLLDSGEYVVNMNCLGRAIAQFHNISKCEMNRLEFNDLLLYKIRIQYNYDLVEGLTSKKKEIYDELHHELLNLNSSFCFVHGDLNAKNIIVMESGEFGIIDFEHSGIGKRVYDLAYLVAEFVIAAIAYPKQRVYRYCIVEFLLGYIEESIPSVFELTSLWNHVAVQILYRLTGPSALVWTSYFSEISLKKMYDVGMRMLGNDFVLSNILSSLDYFID